MTARLAVLAVSAAVLAACAPAYQPHSLVLDADRHQPVVTQEIARLDLPPARQIFPADAPAVEAFLRDYRNVGHGPVLVSVPPGEDAAGVAEDVRAIARISGMAAPEIAVAVSTSDGGSPYNLTFVRYRAHAPECGQDWPSLATTRRSETYANFGCANAANLAAMIVDPADLLAPREMAPADAERRINALNAYRGGAQAGSGSGSAAGGAAAGAEPAPAAGEAE